MPPVDRSKHNYNTHIGQIKYYQNKMGSQERSPQRTRSFAKRNKYAINNDIGPNKH
jgi:hypothetical protein